VDAPFSPTGAWCVSYLSKESIVKARYNIKASQDQQTPEGDFLCFLYYRTGAFDLLQRDESSGFPHDGGQHSLIFHIDEKFGTDDVEAFLDVIEEQYHSHPGCAAFVTEIRARMH
jgi:hypothetical protein